MSTLSSKEKQITINIYKMKILRNIITAIILMSSIICANDVRNLDYEEEENPFVDCFLQKEYCEFELDNDNEAKYLFKMNTIEMLKNGSLNVLINIIEENKTDIIWQTDSDIYEIMNITENHFNENITNINYDECLNYFKKEDYPLNNNNNNNNDNNNNFYFVFQIEHYLPSYRIPVIEHVLFSKNETGIYLRECVNNYLYYFIDVENIDKESLYLYNKSSDYYNDDCAIYKSKNGIDLTLFSRRDIYNKSFLSLCEKDCEFMGYDSSSSRVVCRCDSRNKIFSVSDLNSNDLIFFFDNNEQKITNFHLLKCYFLITTKDNIIKNPGFYSTAIAAGFFVLMFLIFCIFGYRSLSKRIDQAIKMKFHPNKKEDINNKRLIFINDADDTKTSKRTSILEDKIHDKRKKKHEKRRNHKNDSKKDSKIHKSKSISFSGRNMLNLGNDKRQETLRKKTTGEEKENSGVIFIFENDYEINTLSFDDAIRYDKRTCWQYYMSLLRNKQLFFLSFLDFNSYNSVILKKPIFFLSFVYSYGINAFFFTDELMNEIYEDGGKYDLETLVPNAVYSSLAAVGLIKILVIFLLLSESHILNVKRQTVEKKAEECKSYALKIICVKLVFFFIINASLLTFFLFYLTCFNALYPNTQIFLIINASISFFISNILSFLYNLIPMLFRNDILKFNSKKGSKYRINIEGGDAKYIYRFSQFLQEI